jgi:hypothetical protein
VDEQQQQQAGPPNHIHTVALRESWISPRTLLDVLLIIFTFGVMLATCKYSDTATKSQRPWIGAVEIGSQVGTQYGSVTSSFTMAANTPTDVVVAYRNYGLSPALKSAVSLHTILSDMPPSADKDWKPDTAPSFPDCHQEVDARTGVTLFPNSDSSFMLYHEPSHQRPSYSTLDTEAIKDGKKTIFLIGCIGYLDQWGIRHHTDLCSYFTHPDDSLTGGFAYCASGNEAD